MTANAVAAPRHVSVASRLFGLGSVFGKTIRDSRRATLVVGAIVALIMVAAGKVMASDYGTIDAREQLADFVRNTPPIIQGLAGKPVNLETLGGFMAWKYGVFFPLIAGLWSILALSSTLAGETRRGTLEFVAAEPVARRQIAVEKLLGHAVMVGTAMVVVVLSAWAAGRGFAKLPGDEISLAAALSYAVWLGLMALASGAVAFALAPFLGRAAAAGLAGAFMFAGFILNGYQSTVPEFGPFASLSWFGWTSNHIPLAGQYDWPPVALMAAVTLGLMAIGVEAFARRDLGATVALRTPRVPGFLLGLRAPLGRSLGELLPTTLAWGLGLGIFGLGIAASSRSFGAELAKTPDLTRFFASWFPGVDIASAAGFLELVFVNFGLILAGLAAATLVGTWASDETTGRLELLLTTPLARARWALWSGLGVLVAVALFVLVMAVGIALGAVAAGSDALTPVEGTIPIGLYAAAFVGIGLAVGGLFRTELAAPTVATLVIVTWLVDFTVPALRLPEPLSGIHGLALSSHIGQPMVGIWDGGGLAICAALAVGGLALGVWGMARRDISR